MMPIVYFMYKKIKNCLYLEFMGNMVKAILLRVKQLFYRHIDRQLACNDRFFYG